MSALFDDSPGIISASAASLIVYFWLVTAIPVVWTISEKDEKHSEVNGLAFPRGVERCPRSHMVQLWYNAQSLHIGHLTVKLLRLDYEKDVRIIYSGDCDYFSLDGSVS